MARRLRIGHPRALRQLADQASYTVTGQANTLTYTAGQYSGDPRSQPLLTSADWSYLGAFKLPPGLFNGGDFAYGGTCLSFYADPVNGDTLYVRSDNASRRDGMAQVRIPSDANIRADASGSTLSTASVLQNFYSVTAGQIADGVFDAGGNPSYLYGSLLWNGRLLVAAATTYGSGSPTNGAIGAWSSSTLSSGTFTGFKYITGATSNRRSQGGPMCVIPSEWRTLLGGNVMAGNGTGPLSIIGNSSYGFSLNSFDADQLVTANASVPGKTLAFFSSGQTMAGPSGDPSGGGQSDLWNQASAIAGYIFPPGTRTVGVLMAHGRGPYGYGGTPASFTVTNISTAGGFVDVTFTRDQPGSATLQDFSQIWSSNTSDATQYAAGRVYFQNVGGMTTLNHGATPSNPSVQFYYAKYLTANSVRICTDRAGTPLSSAGLSAWTSGGSMRIFDTAWFGATAGSREQWTHDDYNSPKGPHSSIPQYGYSTQLVLYDATQLSEVYAGTRSAWDLTPYARYELPDNRSNNPTGTISGMPRHGAFIGSVAYDPAKARMYVTESYGDQSRVEVFQLTKFN